MTTKWQEKGVGTLLRKGTSERKPVTDERNGKVGGYHIEHWDDSRDAVVKPGTVEASIKVKEG